MKGVGREGGKEGGKERARREGRRGERREEGGGKEENVEGGESNKFLLENSIF